MRSRADKLRAIINCPTVNPHEKRAAERALEKHERKGPSRPVGQPVFDRLHWTDYVSTHTTRSGARIDFSTEDMWTAWSKGRATRYRPDPAPPEAPEAEHGYEGRWEEDTRGRDGRVLTFDVKRDDAPSYIRGTAVRVKAPDGKVYDCRVLAVRLCPRYQPSHVITEPVGKAAGTPFWMGGPRWY